MQIRSLFSAVEVENRVAELAEQLYRDYADSPLAILAIAEGAVRFTEALVGALAGRGLRPHVQTVQARRTSGTEIGAVQIESFDVATLDDCDVLVVDDVADEGRTLRAVLELVSLSDCRSVKTAVLVNKRNSRREPIQLDYVGFEVESGWVVGFGMDIDGELRDLDEIGVVDESDPGQPSSSRRRSKG
ncbi:MAG: phosphoribosyltransferase family protein [Myxococcota bacterium]